MKTNCTKLYKRDNGIYYYQLLKGNGEYTSPKTTGCRTKKDAQNFVNSLFFNKNLTIIFYNYSKDFFSKDSTYSQWKLVNNQPLSPETIDAYNKRLINQILPYFCNYELKEITRKDVKDFIIKSSQKWSAKTVNAAQSVLNIILKQAVEDDLIPFNPAQGLSFRKVQKKDRELLTVDEIKQIYQCDCWSIKELKKVFLLGAITGMRISEIMALQNRDISQKYIFVKHSYSRKYGLGPTKTKEMRYVPIPDHLQLRTDGKPNDYIFSGFDGVPYDICRMNYNISKISEKFDIDVKARGITTHTLRNFFISYLQKAGVPEAKIRAVVGHKDSSMTGLYTYWTPAMFQEVYDAQQKLYDFIVQL